MKTQWSLATYNRARDKAAWKRERRERRERFEKQTGVRWVSYTTGQKIVFHPTWQRDKCRKPDRRERQAILSLLTKNGISFLEIQKRTRIPLKDLLPYCLWLCKRYMCTPTVGRTNNANGLRTI